jgi:hypothetical protein
LRIHLDAGALGSDAICIGTAADGHQHAIEALGGRGLAPVEVHAQSIRF